MTAPLEFDAQVALLAARLVDRRDGVLARWRECVARDAQVTAADSLSRAQFIDHIPDVLRALHDVLVSSSHRAEARGVEAAQGHGMHRWQQGYALLEVIREWSHLQVAVIAEIQQAAEEQPGFDVRALNAAHRAIAALCLEGMSHSVAEFERLQRSEAESQLHDLGHTLGLVRDFEQRQAQLLRGVAHDLRGNMGILSSATAAMRFAELPPDRREELFAVTQRAIAGQTQLLSDLMDLARLQAGLERRIVSDIDVAQLLTELCATAQPFAGERQLYVHCQGPRDMRVQGDAGKIARIVQNLVLNALHYTRAGGVSVRWGDSAPNDTGRWKIDVVDTGPGIPTEAAAPLADAIAEATQEARNGGDAAAVTPPPRAERIDPNLPPKAASHGEGIGLSIVKRLCELLDATLAMNSTPERGTSFSIVLPRRYAD